MGLPTLREKIAQSLCREDVDERDVVYLLVEIGKYLERGDLAKQHLGDPDYLKLDRNNYLAVVFFRNCVAHAEKEHGKIPDAVSAAFDKALDVKAAADADKEIMEVLKAELDLFAEKVNAPKLVAWKQFELRLKLVLAEQPVKIGGDKLLCYDQNGSLRTF